MKQPWQREQKGDRTIRIWFGITVLAAGICLHRLATVGETSLHPVFLGFSVSRLIMMTVPLLFGLFGLAGAIDPGRKISAFIQRIAGKKLTKIFLTLAFLLLSLGWIVGGFLADRTFLPYFQRLQPLLLYGIALSAGSLLLIFHLTSANNRRGTEQASIRRRALLYFLFACAIYLLIRLTRIGITPDEMDWQPIGMAVQYWELWVSMWLALAIRILLQVLRASRNRTVTTVLLFLGIWIGTAVLWVSIPSMKVLAHSYFMEITAPNNLPYPASDSAYYGLWAETVLAGLGFKANVTTRQFLIIMIAFFEHLTGGDILKTIDCLTVLLALIPAFSYLLGRKLHSHGAGILVAGIASLREYNTIMLGPHYMVSNAKMLLSDLPALLCMLIILCAAADWFRKPRSLPRLLMTGSLVGFSVTVRSQFIILIPFLAVCFLLKRGLSFREKLLPAVGFVLAALMVVAPWLIRSKILTGEFLLDEPGIHSTELARRWSDDPDLVIERQPGEDDAAYAARNQQHMADFFKENPLYVARFTVSHFFANVLSGLCALPFGTDPRLTVRDVTNTDFHNVEGRLIPAGFPAELLLFLAFIALGMSAARKRMGSAGMLPFYACLVYLFLTAAGRYSGWRFALPADWFCYFYASLGIAEAALQTAAHFGAKVKSMVTIPEADLSTQPAAPALSLCILMVFLTLGALPALSGKLIPQQVFLNSTAENIHRIETLPRSADLEKLTQFLASDGKTVLNGKIIYPRYFYIGEGLASGHPWTAYKIRNFSRLGFVLLNEKNHDVILPLETVPAFIPNAADIYVIGENDSEGYFRADAIIIPDTGKNGAPRILISDIQE